MVKPRPVVAPEGNTLPRRGQNISAQGIALGFRVDQHFGSPERAKQGATPEQHFVSPFQG